MRSKFIGIWVFVVSAGLFLFQGNATAEESILRHTGIISITSPDGAVATINSTDVAPILVSGSKVDLQSGCIELRPTDGFVQLVAGGSVATVKQGDRAEVCSDSNKEKADFMVLEGQVKVISGNTTTNLDAGQHAAITLDKKAGIATVESLAGDIVTETVGVKTDIPQGAIGQISADRKTRIVHIESRQESITVTAVDGTVTPLKAGEVLDTPGLSIGEIQTFEIQNTKVLSVDESRQPKSPEAVSQAFATQKAQALSIAQPQQQSGAASESQAVGAQPSAAQNTSSSQQVDTAGSRGQSVESQTASVPSKVESQRTNSSGAGTQTSGTQTSAVQNELSSQQSNESTSATQTPGASTSGSKNFIWNEVPEESISHENGGSQSSIGGPISSHTGVITITSPDGKVVTINATDKLPNIVAGSKIELLSGSIELQPADGFLQLVAGGSVATVKAGDRVRASLDSTTNRLDFNVVAGQVNVVSGNTTTIFDAGQHAAITLDKKAGIATVESLVGDIATETVGVKTTVPQGAVGQTGADKKTRNVHVESTRGTITVTAADGTVTQLKEGEVLDTPGSAEGEIQTFEEEGGTVQGIEEPRQPVRSEPNSPKLPEASPF